MATRHRPATAETPGTTTATTATSEPRRRGFGARDLAYVATFAALIVVLGLPGALYLFGSAVPITLQTLGIMLAAVVLGGRRAAAASLVVIVLCAVGLPVLANGRGGLSILIGPSVGYFVGWVVGAGVAGWFVTRRAPRFSMAWAVAGVLVGGIGVIHVLGIVGMMWRVGMSFDKALTTDLVFVPGDLAKALLAVVIGAAVHRALPGLLPARDGARR